MSYKVKSCSCFLCFYACVNLCIIFNAGRELEARAAETAAELVRAQASAELEMSRESATAAEREDLLTALRQQLREAQRQLAEELQAHQAEGNKSAQAETKARAWQQQAQASARQVGAECFFGVFFATR